jgi:hypothetical protein
MSQDAKIAQTFGVEEGSMNRVLRSLDVVGTTGGKVTLETIRQAAAHKAVATKGAQGRHAAAIKAAALEKGRPPQRKRPRRRARKGAMKPP